MNMIYLVLIGGIALIFFGLVVDWYYKKHGITVDRSENEKHISSTERTNVENMMREIKNQSDTTGW
ncbi:hypothetical protein [Pseudoneobacillus sp. C159]